MFDYRAYAIRKLAELGTKYLPFADVASETVPLGRLMRLSLFQVTVGMALVLLLGTLNRVMIVELDVPASLVAVMISLPILFAPLRALIGFKSDTHRSALGLRRFPYIYKGTILQFGGFAVMPFALLVLSGYGEAIDAPRWIGLASAALSFLLVGAGVHMVQTVGLALATDLVPEADQPKVVGLMYVMLLFGMVGSALVFGWLLSDYSPGRLIQVIQGAAVVTVVLNGISIWKQEALNRARAATPQKVTRFRQAWAEFADQAGALRMLAVVALGTLAFGMADVLLEPYGGQVLQMSVSQTTKLTAVLAFGTLLGFAMASRVLARGGRPEAMCGQGALVGVPGFAMIIAASQIGWTPLFILGTALTGFGAGLFGHGSLTATMRNAPRDRIGMALGAWGAVQATAAGAGVVLGGLIRDGIVALSRGQAIAPEMPYLPVFAIEIAFLALALIVLAPVILRGRRQARSRQPDEDAYIPS